MVPLCVLFKLFITSELIEKSSLLNLWSVQLSININEGIWTRYSITFQLGLWVTVLDAINLLSTMGTVYATRFDMPIDTLPNRVFVFCMIFLINGLLFVATQYFL